LGRALARLCRARGLSLSVAGDWRLAAALGAGLHLRGGRRPCGAPRWLRAATSSAHGVAELRRARREGVLAFLSPAFATASHPGVAGLGPCRWGLMARRGGAVAALGGIDGRRVRLLPGCVGAGAIGALG
jgi:thiamine-phosphate pyrophosphorylase